LICSAYLPESIKVLHRQRSNSIGGAQNAVRRLPIRVFQRVLGRFLRWGSPLISGDEFRNMGANKALVKMTDIGDDSNLRGFRRRVGGMGKQAGVTEFVLEL
jgi:hypothetical protein